MTVEAEKSPVVTEAGEATEPVAEEGFRRFASVFAESRIAVVGLVTCCVIVLAAVFAPLITPQNPYDLATLDLMDSRLVPGEVGSTGMTHWLGTDDQGRDLYSAIIYGLRISIGVGGSTRSQTRCMSRSDSAMQPSVQLTHCAAQLAQPQPFF